MRRPLRFRSRSGGFTLVEILIALALVTGLTLMMFQSIAPWLNLRQRIDTERRLEQVQSALETAYRMNAMDIETLSDDRLRLTYAGQVITVQPSTQSGRRCDENSEAAQALAPYLSDDATRNFTDGAKLPLCLFITPRIQAPAREGVVLYYHVAAIVAVGNDGVLGANTRLSANGILTIDPDSDDIGVVVNGLNIQQELYQETRRRIERVAGILESYFTARFLGNPARDYSIDYFVASNEKLYYDADAEGSGPKPTRGNWLPVSDALEHLGLGPNEQVSVFESNNAIEFANQRLNGGSEPVQVQEPAAKGGLALPPYTALLRARLPGPTDNYLMRVVPGNY